MSVHELSNDFNNLVIRNVKQQDRASEHQGRGHLARKSSTCSNASSSFDKRKNVHRTDSEVKIEAILKELFSPDAKIIDHYEGEKLMMHDSFKFSQLSESFRPGIKHEENETNEALSSNRERFKLRRQTSLEPKMDIKKKASSQRQVRVNTKKSPSPLRKLSTPTQRKRSASSTAPLPKLSAPPSLKPNFVTADGTSSGSFLRKNPIPLRRGLSIAQ